MDIVLAEDGFVEVPAVDEEFVKVEEETIGESDDVSWKTASLQDGEGSGSDQVQRSSEDEACLLDHLSPPRNLLPSRQSVVRASQREAQRVARTQNRPWQRSECICVWF